MKRSRSKYKQWNLTNITNINDLPHEIYQAETTYRTAGRSKLSRSSAAAREPQLRPPRLRTQLVKKKGEWEIESASWPPPGMSSSTPPATTSSATPPDGKRRRVPPNPNFPPQPAVLATNERRGRDRIASATTPAPASPSPTMTRKGGTGKTTPKTANAPTTPKSTPTTPAKKAPPGTAPAETVPSKAAPDGATPAMATPTADGSGDDDAGKDGIWKKLGELEGRVKEELKEVKERLITVEEKAEKRECEINDLRDRLQEEEFGKLRLEEKVKELLQQQTELKNEVEKEKEKGKEREKEMAEREERLKNRIKELEERGKGGEGTERENNGGGERSEGGNDGGGERQVEGGSGGRENGDERKKAGKEKYKCIVITDSNGRGATSDSIKNHMPVEEREKYDITNAVAYTVDEAYDRVKRGDIDVSGAFVVVDNLTNDVRGAGQRMAASPDELIQRVHKLRESMSTAEAVIICEIKPMRNKDVTPYNRLLHSYLRRQGTAGVRNFGCRTQIRMDWLKGDGFHVKPQYDSVIDRTYACALLGQHVPSPTPTSDFVPESVKRRQEANWPLPGNRWGGRALDEGLSRIHGWRY